jgi:hypothetical protein
MAPPHNGNSDFDFSDDAPLQSFNKVGVPVWVVCALAIFFVGLTVTATWWIATQLNDIKNQFSELNRKLDVVTSDKWTASDMRYYNWDLERRNKGTIQVPDPDEIRAKVK